MSTTVAELLEPLAAWFRSLGIPEVVTHWGHPLMMSIVVLLMGSSMAYAGWQGRTATDEEKKAAGKAMHRQLAPLVFLFITTGYTGGVLSLVMQHKPIFESPHFVTGTVAIALFGLNGVLSAGFGDNKAGLRTAHAYLGSSVMILLFAHAVLGLNLGLKI